MIQPSRSKRCSTRSSSLHACYRDGNRRLDQIASTLTTEQADIVLGYLRAVSEAVRAASDELEQPNDL
jgi:hypothetical protein